MNKKDAYKKGVNDTSKTYTSKFEDLKEGIRATQNKQDCINIANQNLQREIIQEMKAMDTEIDKIYDLIGEERTPGVEGKAEILESTSQTMTAYMNGTLSKYNTFSNFSSVSIDYNLADSIAKFLTTNLEYGMNESFQKKLTILEQNGLLSKEKFEKHQRSVVRAKTLTAVGVYTAFSLAPIVSAQVSNFLNKRDIVKYIIGSFAYINHEITPLIVYEISDLLLQMDIKINKDTVYNTFNQFKRDASISHIPMFSKRNQIIFGESGKDTLAKEIVSRCDLHDSDVENRALEYIEDFLKLRPNEAKCILDDSRFAQKSLSDITWHAAINFRYIFLDFIKNVENAQKFAYFDLENDTYYSIRESRKEKMESIVTDVNSRKQLFLTSKGRKDIIDASAKLIQYQLNPIYDISMDYKIIKRSKEVLNAYGLQ